MKARGEADARLYEQMLKYKYRVPETVLRALRVAYADKAVVDGQDIKMNRIYTLIALCSHKHLGFGRKRCERFLQQFSDMYQEFVESGNDWHKPMQELADDVGLIIRTGEDGDELYEYEQQTEGSDVKRKQ